MHQIDTINSIAFALDPTNVPSFLLDWEVTKPCNLDCSYCDTGPNGSHDNSTEHTPFENCIKSIDFMFEYVDTYNQYKKLSQRNVILNVYGGESLFHPNIVEILQACRSKYQKYANSWHLTINCTTNGIVGKNQWKKIVPLVDEFTVSYHPENLAKQKKQYLDNVLYLKNNNKNFKCIVMMHNNKDLFDDSLAFSEILKQHQILYVLKPVDIPGEEWEYTTNQFDKFKTFWISKTATKQQFKAEEELNQISKEGSTSSITKGRPCCGGRKISLNNDLKSSIMFINKQGFRDWYCSVNWFFLSIREVSGHGPGAVYINKDCQTSTVTNKVEPLGFVNDAKQIIETLKNQLETNTMPIIKCVKDICRCGICAPKSNNLEDFKQLIKRNVIQDVFQNNNILSE